MSATAASEQPIMESVYVDDTGTVILSYFKAKMLQNRFLPPYAGRAYSASPNLLARFKGPYLAYKGGEGRKGT